MRCNIRKWQIFIFENLLIQENMTKIYNFIKMELIGNNLRVLLLPGLSQQKRKKFFLHLLYTSRPGTKLLESVSRYLNSEAWKDESFAQTVIRYSLDIGHDKWLIRALHTRCALPSSLTYVEILTNLLSFKKFKSADQIWQDYGDFIELKALVIYFSSIGRLDVVKWLVNHKASLSAECALVATMSSHWDVFSYLINTCHVEVNRQMWEVVSRHIHASPVPASVVALFVFSPTFYFYTKDYERLFSIAESRDYELEFLQLAVNKYTPWKHTSAGARMVLDLLQNNKIEAFLWLMAHGLAEWMTDRYVENLQKWVPLSESLCELIQSFEKKQSTYPQYWMDVAEECEHAHKDCPVCLDRLGNKHMHCINNHAICIHCQNMWNKTCPLCRTDCEKVVIK